MLRDGVELHLCGCQPRIRLPTVNSRAARADGMQRGTMGAIARRTAAMGLVRLLPASPDRSLSATWTLAQMEQCMFAASISPAQPMRPPTRGRLARFGAAGCTEQGA